MAQGVLPYKYEEEKAGSGMTALAGLPLYPDLASVLDVGTSIANHLHVKERGWTDQQILLSLILLNLAGGDCVDDLSILEADQGFCKVLSRIETRGLTRQQRSFSGYPPLCTAENDGACPCVGIGLYRYRKKYDEPGRWERPVQNSP